MKLAGFLPAYSPIAKSDVLLRTSDQGHDEILLFRAGCKSCTDNN
jgi:hypothetical protein